MIELDKDGILTDRSLYDLGMLTISELEKCQELAFTSSGGKEPEYTIANSYETRLASSRKIAKAQAEASARVADEETYNSVIQFLTKEVGNMSYSRLMRKSEDLCEKLLASTTTVKEVQREERERIKRYLEQETDLKFLNEEYKEKWEGLWQSLKQPDVEKLHEMGRKVAKRQNESARQALRDSVKQPDKEGE